MKKRNEIIINFIGSENVVNDVIVVPKVSKEKKPRQPKVKPITNDDLIIEIIDFLNECTGKSYKANSKLAILNKN